jgi:magnesium transporter
MPGAGVGSSRVQNPRPLAMLTIHPASAPTLSEGVWLELLDPSDDERRQVEQATQLRLPTKADLDEIESSSRVFTEGDVAYLSTPVLTTTDCMKGGVTSIGFVLSASKLVTLGFAPVTAFASVAKRLGSAGAVSARSTFFMLLEEIVEDMADALEHASAELESVSRAAFHVDPPQKHRSAHTGDKLRATLRKLGRMADGLSHVRDSLLGLGRIATFAHDRGHSSDAEDLARCHAIQGDLASLSDYQGQLLNKVQLLLDATLGFINIEQNDVVKTLTIVSVVGVPPVVIAGVYGMNFQHMPELSWTFGYPLALGLMVVSALLPLVWFKWRGWL